MSGAIPPVCLHGVHKDNFTFTFYTGYNKNNTCHGRVELKDFTQQ